MMNEYNLLFSVMLEHAYYVNGDARDLVLEPIGPTRELMRRYDVHARMDGNRLIVFYGNQAGNAPALAYAQGSLSFYFTLHCLNPYFLNITEIPFYHPQTQRLYGASIGKTPNEAGFTSLTLGASADERDLLPVDAPVFKDLNISGPVLGLFQVVVGRSDGMVAPPRTDGLPVEETRFSLSFQARQANWRYLLVNKSQLPFGRLDVFDGRTPLEFQEGQPRKLRGTDQIALPLASATTYPIQERTNLRPKLRLSPNEAAALNRDAFTTIDLPTPDRRRIVPETVDGQQRVFADMYVFL